MHELAVATTKQLLNKAERSGPADAAPFYEALAFAADGSMLQALQSSQLFPDRGWAHQLMLGHCLLRAGQVRAAFETLQALFDAGLRNPFLLDMFIVAHAETGRFEEGYRLLAETPDLLRAVPGLIKRLAGFAYASGRIDAANQAAERIRSWCSPALLAQVEASNRVMEEAIFADPDTRRQLLGARYDSYLDPAAQLRNWLSYAREHAEVHDSYSNSVGFLNTLFSREVAALRSAGAVEAVVNFGSLFGSLESRLAAEHPGCAIVGHDRSVVATRKNQDRFRADNLTFTTGDLAAALAPLVAGRVAVLCHGRTATLMYPDELTQLYKTCRSLGIRHILAVEDVNFNLPRARWPDFGRDHPKTVLMGGHLMIHDYEAYLGAAGYRIERLARRAYPFPLGGSINGEAMVIEIRHARLASADA